MIFRTTCATLLLLAAAGAAYAQQAAPSPGGDDPAALRAEIERLKSIVPGQATAMKQVAWMAGARGDFRSRTQVLLRSGEKTFISEIGGNLAPPPTGTTIRVGFNLADAVVVTE